MGQEITYVFNNNPVVIKNTAQVDSQQQQQNVQQGNVFSTTTNPSWFGNSPVFEANSRVPGFAGDLVFAGEMEALKQLPNVYLAQMFGYQMNGQQGGQVQQNNGQNNQGNNSPFQGGNPLQNNGQPCPDTSKAGGTGNGQATGAGSTATPPAAVGTGAPTNGANGANAANGTGDATAAKGANGAEGSKGTNGAGATRSDLSPDGKTYLGNALDKSRETTDSQGHKLYAVKTYADTYASENGQTIQVKAQPTEHWLSKDVLTAYGVTDKEQMVKLSNILKEFNPEVKDADLIYPGQKIFLPADIKIGEKEYHMKNELRDDQPKLQAEADKVAGSIHAPKKSGFASKADNKASEEKAAATTTAPVAVKKETNTERITRLRENARINAKTQSEKEFNAIIEKEHLDPAAASTIKRRQAYLDKTQEIIDKKFELNMTIANRQDATAKKPADDNELVNISKGGRTCFITKGALRARENQSKINELRDKADKLSRSDHGSKVHADDDEKVQISNHSRVTYITKGQQRARAEAEELRAQANKLAQ